MREPEHTRHKRAHVLGRLGVSVLETSDGGEDLGEGDEEVGGCLDPDGKVGRYVAVACEFAARGFGVDEVLDESGDDHAHHRADEAGLDLLDGSEVDAHAGKLGVEEFVEDGDEAGGRMC